MVAYFFLEWSPGGLQDRQRQAVGSGKGTPRVLAWRQLSGKALLSSQLQWAGMGSKAKGSELKHGPEGRSVPLPPQALAPLA